MSMSLVGAAPSLLAPAAPATAPTSQSTVPAPSREQLSSIISQLTSAVAQLKPILEQLAAARVASGAQAMAGATQIQTNKPAAASGGGAQPATAKIEAKPAAAAASTKNGAKLGSLAPDQHKDGTTLTKEEGANACGPAAATALARFAGKGVNLDDVAKVARKHGWNAGGMTSGSKGVEATLKELGVKVDRQATGSVDWNRVKADVKAGKPVIVATEGHYWVAEGYNDATGQYNFTKTGTAVRGGKEWMTPQEMAGNGRGAAVTAMYLA